jgi:GT2 family glycosyltransferase
MQEFCKNIGVAIITCDRPSFYKQCEESLLKIVNEYENICTMVVDDGLISTTIDSSINKYTKTPGKIGVGKAKNLALKYFLDNGYTHIFLLEDDIEIINTDVFHLYIKASETTGIKHFNFGLHGNHNLDPSGNPIIRKSVNYPDGTVIDLYPNILGALSYFHTDALKDVGLMDESFFNALEHVDHTLQMGLKGYHPPFRWFADVHNSSLYLKDIVANHEQSKIRSEQDFMENFRKNLDIFIQKNKFSVVTNYGPAETYTSEKDMLDSLKQIWKLHHQK